MPIPVPEPLPQDDDLPEDLNLAALDEIEEKLEEDVIKKLEEKIELKQMEPMSPEVTSLGFRGLLEQTLLMGGATVLIIVLPFLRYTNGIILTLFALAISLIAGLTSPKKWYSPLLNLVISAAGTLIFEYAAIIQFHTYSFTVLLVLYQLLAVIFLFATYFSMGTYRRKVLDS